MTRPVFRKIVSQFRVAGIDIFVTPAQVGGLHGMAWAEADPLRLFINIHANPCTKDGLFTLLHEIGHHCLGHTTVHSTQPMWSSELAASQWALDMLREFAPDTVPAMERRAKRHIRPMVQSYLDAGIFVHGEREAGAWAGCKMPPPDDPLNDMDEVPL